MTTMQNSISELLRLFPRLSFAELPSPVFALPESAMLPAGSNSVYVKHDGVCATSYAGNKVRKLEFLLAEAQLKGANHIVTLGAAGSNHAVATSTYAKKIGMRCTVCMTHQPPSPSALKNLRRHVALGTELHVYSHYFEAVAHATALTSKAHTTLLPLGGSTPLASLGYICAAQELAQQIEDGLLPCPKRIYVACGTMGTAVGLTLGIALLNLPVQVVAVRVTERAVASQDRFARLYAKSVDTLTPKISRPGLDPTLRPDQMLFVDDFFGNAYAEPTPEALNAIEVAALTNLTLDGTYTGKAFAAMLAHLAAGEFEGPALFWCTLNSVDTQLADLTELSSLGPDFERYILHARD